MKEELQLLSEAVEFWTLLHKEARQRKDISPQTLGIVKECLKRNLSKLEGMLPEVRDTLSEKEKDNLAVIRILAWLELELYLKEGGKDASP